MKSEMNKMGRALSIMWASTKGRIALLASGGVALLVVGALIAGAVITSKPTSVDAGGEQVATGGVAGADGEGDLFSDPVPPPANVSPVAEPNGQIEIGGGGIPANTTDLIFQDAPEAVVDPRTGLVPLPKPVPHEQLVVPLVERMSVQECASSRIPEARDYADDIIAYLYTWDAGEATWEEFITPVHDLWGETLGRTGKSDEKYSTGSNWENTIGGFGYGPQQWGWWADAGMSSEVRINSVLTTVGAKGAPTSPPYGVRLEYTVTVVRQAPGQKAQEKEMYPTVTVYAPCPKGEFVPASWRESLTNLQLGEFTQRVQR